jgi:class 3 adenylate cyclase/pimeloyl-ACP methyl ester carboxylesterase
MRPSIRYAKRKDGVRIAYIITGEGPTLICPQGWVTNLLLYYEDPLIQNFYNTLAEEYSIVSYDRYGCGQSDRNRTNFTLEDELLDLEAVVDTLNLSSLSIFAFSISGAAAVTFSVKNPEKVDKLILYGAYANGNLVAPEEVQTAVISIVRASWGMGSKALSDIFIPGATPEARKAFVEYQKNSASAEVAANLLSLTYSLDVTDILPKLKVPTLVLHRDKDTSIGIQNGQNLAQLIPNAEFRVLRGNLHFPWLGDSQEVIGEVLNFLSEGKIKRDPEKKFVAPSDGSDIVEQTTIMFTDIVSSTNIVSEVGDAKARDLFVQHDKLIRKLIAKYGGIELQNLGDGFMLSFPSATYAIRCACAMQQTFSHDLPQIKLKIGINTGEVVIREGHHPFGQAVVIASRIVEKCAGQQILISDISKGLASGSKFVCSEIGKFKPKGIDYSVKLFEVIWSE